MAAGGVTDDRLVPRNVRAIMPDGEVIPLELVCLGRRRGKWRWVCAWTLREPPARLDHDWLPADATVLVNSARPYAA